MHGIHFFGPLLSTLVMLGFAYILWTFALKEKDTVQTAGKVLAGALIIVAVLQFVMAGFFHGPRGPRCPDMQKGRAMLEQKGGAQGDFSDRQMPQDGKIPGPGSEQTAQKK